MIGANSTHMNKKLSYRRYWKSSSSGKGFKLIRSFSGITSVKWSISGNNSISFSSIKSFYWSRCYYD